MKSRTLEHSFGGGGLLKIMGAQRVKTKSFDMALSKFLKRTELSPPPLATGAPG